VLDAPSPAHEWGIRDRSMGTLQYSAGMRVRKWSDCADDHEFSPANVFSCPRKCRRERALPLWRSRRQPRCGPGWRNEQPGQGTEAFLIPKVMRLQLRFAVHHGKHVQTAAKRAKSLLQACVDTLPQKA